MLRCQVMKIDSRHGCVVLSARLVDKHNPIQEVLQALHAGEDLRLVLGTMPEALAFCRMVADAPGKEMWGGCRGRQSNQSGSLSQ